MNCLEECCLSTTSENNQSRIPREPYGAEVSNRRAPDRTTHKHRRRDLLSLRQQRVRRLDELNFVLLLMSASAASAQLSSRRSEHCSPNATASSSLARRATPVPARCAMRFDGTETSRHLHDRIGASRRSNKQQMSGIQQIKYAVFGMRPFYVFIVSCCSTPAQFCPKVSILLRVCARFFQ
jgi:hypothetical protein